MSSSGTAFARQSLTQATEAVPRTLSFRQIVVQMIFSCWPVSWLPNMHNIHMPNGQKIQHGQVGIFRDLRSVHQQFV